MSVKKSGLVLAEIAMAIVFAASAGAQGPDESSEVRSYRYLPKSQPNLLPNSQLNSETLAHLENCGELIALYGEDWQTIKAALKRLVDKSANPSPVRDAEILRRVRFGRLPTHLARAIESFYLLCEVQAQGARQGHRIQMATAELALWAGISPDATAQLARQAFGGQLPPGGPPTAPPLPPPPPGGGESGDGFSRFSPSNPPALQESYLLIRPAVIQVIQALLEVANDDDQKIDRRIGEFAYETTLGNRGQLREVVLLAVEERIKRKLTPSEQKQVWTEWLNGRSLNEICAKLPPIAASVIKPISEKHLEVIPRRNPSPSERACIKTYASFCGLTVEEMLAMKADQLANYRDRIDILTMRYDNKVASADTNELENSLRNTLAAGMNSEQLRLYGDYLLLRALSHEGEWDSVVATFESIMRNRSILVRYVERDDADKATHFSEESLQNIIVLHGIRGKLAASEKNTLTATKQLLDNYNELKPYFELLALDDRRTSAVDETETELLSALFDLAIRKPEKFVGNDKIESHDDGLIITLKGRHIHFVHFDNLGIVIQVGHGN